MSGELWDSALGFVSMHLTGRRGEVRIFFDEMPQMAALTTTGTLVAASFTNLLRHEYVHNVDFLLNGYLKNLASDDDGYLDDQSVERRQDPASAVRLHIFEQLLHWGADPYQWGELEIMSEGGIRGWGLHGHDLTRSAFIHGHLHSWLKILIKNRHSPFNALKSAVDFWVELPERLQDILHDDLDTALRAFGYNAENISENISEIVNGTDTRFSEFMVQTSSIDFEPGLITRCKELDSTEPTLVQRNARRYEDD